MCIAGKCYNRLHLVMLRETFKQKGIVSETDNFCPSKDITYTVYAIGCLRDLYPVVDTVIVCRRNS